MGELVKYIDIAVGLAVVMLLLSTVVAAIVQVITSGAFARALFLRRGLTRLIGQIDDGLKPHAHQIADAILRHPMIGHEGSGFERAIATRIVKTANAQLAKTVPGAVVEREEFVRVILEIAANEGPLKDLLPTDLREHVRDALRRNQLTDPAATLRAIREKRIELELDQPQLAQAVWNAQAVMLATSCDFVGKVNSWFDNTMARVTQRFASNAKAVTSVVSLVLVFVIQLDTHALVTRLSTDDKLRQELVGEAQSLVTRVDRPAVAADTSTDQQKLEAVQTSLADMRKPPLQLIPEHLVWDGMAALHVPSPTSGWAGQRWRLKVDDQTYHLRGATPDAAAVQRAIRDTPADVAVEKSPAGFAIVARRQAANRLAIEHELNGKWEPHASSVAREFHPSLVLDHVGGVLISWVLISLGAPFWYDALKNLLKFRSVIAQKEEKNREEREKTQPPPPVRKRAAGADA